MFDHVAVAIATVQSVYQCSEKVRFKIALAVEKAHRFVADIRTSIRAWSPEPVNRRGDALAAAFAIPNMLSQRTNAQKCLLTSVFQPRDSCPLKQSQLVNELVGPVDRHNHDVITSASVLYELSY
eukprot:COSAG02_NODE_5629_length_4171_cov_2.909180_3_plen_125_part_00